MTGSNRGSVVFCWRPGCLAETHEDLSLQLYVTLSMFLSAISDERFFFSHQLKELACLWLLSIVFTDDLEISFQNQKNNRNISPLVIPIEICADVAEQQHQHHQHLTLLIGRAGLTIYIAKKSNTTFIILQPQHNKRITGRSVVHLWIYPYS